MSIDPAPLKENEFRISEVPSGSVLLVGSVAIFNVDGGFVPRRPRARMGRVHSIKAHSRAQPDVPMARFAFNVCTGAVLLGPAQDPLRTYTVTVEGEVARMDVRSHTIEG